MAHPVRRWLQAVRPTPTPSLPRNLTHILNQPLSLSLSLTLTRCIGGYDPDMVVSLHPLCQNLPLKASV